MKKFTKILSLALALALVLSTTAFAETVYYVQDFSQYENLSALLADLPNAGATPDAAIAINMRNQEKNIFYRTSNAPASGMGATAAAPSLDADANGVKWFTMFTNAAKAGQSGYFAAVPDRTWDYLENKDETYIISYSVKTSPQGTVAGNTRQTFSSMWSSDEVGTAKAGEGMIDIARFPLSSFEQNGYGDGDPDKIWVRAYRNKDWYGENCTQTEISANVPHKIATGYRYETYETEDGIVAYNYPRKATAVDGVLVASSNAASSVTSATPKLVGFNFIYGYYMGLATTNYKMYTIKNDEALNALDVAEIIPTTNASVTVKFSLPVGALDKSAVTIDGLVNGTDFTVSDVKDVVTSNDVYSTVTLNFTKALEGNTTYTINFPATTTNEIGTAIADATATFTTDKNPTYILALEGYEGLAAGTTQIAADDMEGKTVYFKATATNDTGRATSGVLAIGIYEGENLVKYAFANKTFATDGAVNTFSAAFKLEAGQTAKAFVTGSESVKVFGE